jgi:hypothetical protein
MEQVIRVTGLAELNRALRQLDKDAPKRLRVAFNDAAELLVSRARPKVPSRSGNARASMKAKSTRTMARVSVGGTKARYYPWLDFGGKTGIGGSVVRPFFKEGRYVYPTLREIRPDILANLEQGLRDVVRSTGMDVD